MAEQLTPRPQSGFQAAIEDLTDGLSRLVRQHFDLARAEVRQEATEMSLFARAAAICVGLFLVGYVLLLVAIILTAAWLGGVGPMAITAIILALAHLGGAAIAYWRLDIHKKQSDLSLPQTTEELQRNKKWIKEIRENSSPKLTAENS